LKGRKGGKLSFRLEGKRDLVGRGFGGGEGGGPGDDAGQKKPNRRGEGGRSESRCWGGGKKKEYHCAGEGEPGQGKKKGKGGIGPGGNCRMGREVAPSKQILGMRGGGDSVNGNSEPNQDWARHGEGEKKGSRRFP